MKKKSFISSIFTVLIIIISAVDASAQAMLKGNPSLDNFIGSPGMWVIFTGIIVLVACVLFMRKNSKLIPEAVRKTSVQ